LLISKLVALCGSLSVFIILNLLLFIIEIFETDEWLRDPSLLDLTLERKSLRVIVIQYRHQSVHDFK
jgi:hypothetical protein